MHFVYIIYSPANNRYYIGESFNPSERVMQHNTGLYENSSTAFAKDWQLELVLTMKNKSDALKVERYIKSMKSKLFNRKLIQDPLFLNQFKQIVLDKFHIEIS
jgi:putative endonuclease